MSSDLQVIAIASRVQSGELTAEAATERALGRIAALDGEVHAFLRVAGDEALAQARSIDQRRARGEVLGKLAGVPIAIKDAICTRGLESTAASKILAGYVPPYDATVVARLRAADAVIVGKTNMDEFAMGSSSENSAFGPTRNPWDLTRTPGGSSAGSAGAVSARMVSCSLGSDTGGSIRQPAALTGTVGIKPTYGRVSRYGLIAFASSLDQVGPFATDVRGAARVLSVIAGHDRSDATSLVSPVGDYEAACGRSVRGLRIGVPDEYFAGGLDEDVAASVRAAIAELEAQGCIVRPVTLPHTPYAVATYYVLATAEASSNLARFDGVRFGLRAVAGEAGRDLRAMYGTTRDAGFGAEVKRRVLLGTFVLSAGYYDAYYLKAQKVRTLIRRDFERAFDEVDVICSPASPTPAFKLGEKTSDPLSMYLSDIYTLPASLAGIPAISVPCAPARSGLPVGLQIMARPLDEATMIAVASAWEARSPAYGVAPALAKPAA
ncbi:MAG TPA: Asp-tRNA(Asn)/Glu-tRNA(Gln) amidotransferase subunit GatA [Polyangiaceae bacterium]|jgi:aspartyl-tRNA(Asn)/glutamyl-tRNA(Gln) amidotransferase subunit A|nr:Asp-tRNA(Asn)/Glu-tRNA(Gln) amidotransferase subunit GatA [Polyangiaceae bacterium]